jgi:hypothetical protein
MDKPMYCNGPLKPDTWYDVRMRAFTNGGYSDSKLFRIKTSEYPMIFHAFPANANSRNMPINATRLNKNTHYLTSSFVICPDSELDVALVIGAVFGILIVGILVTMMLLVRKCSPYM